MQPTLVNRATPDVMAQAIEWAKKGDTSTSRRNEEGGGDAHGVKTDLAVRDARRGCPIEYITKSSDANCPMAKERQRKTVKVYIAPVDFTRREIRDIVHNRFLPFEKALTMVTTTPPSA
jgi:hypothetical protein